MAAGIAIGVRERVLEFLAKYGEKGYLVLKAAVEAAISGRGQRRGLRLGDFSYREVVAKLKEYGVEYNPANLLSRLEREYAVIETSYKTSGQHWWKFANLDAVIEAIDEYERGGKPGFQAVEAGETLTENEIGVASEEMVEPEEPLVDDPQVEVIRAQIAALGPHELLARLRMLASKPRLTSYDRKLFARIAFEELEMVAQVLEKARAYPEYFAEEIRVLESILRLSSLIARKLMAPGAGVKRGVELRARMRAMT